jgi:ubiquinone/menaquinone biosynthesis C-methylase UbiE
MKTRNGQNRFDDFFASKTYTLFKEHLYNYQARKRLIQKRVEQHGRCRSVLEVGSGISPVCAGISRTVYSDLSIDAMRQLKSRLKKGDFVVADIVALPFKHAAFSIVVCSEVLEHLPDDGPAMGELSRVCAQRGTLLLTVPHRQAYWSVDDRFVEHFRRYDLETLNARLRCAGFVVHNVQKVLGPLEKATMMVIVMMYKALQATIQSRKGTVSRAADHSCWRLVDFGVRWLNQTWLMLVQCEARLLPLSMATVLMIEAHRQESR